VLALPIAGIALVVLFAVEWAVGNVFASTYLGVRPGWDELAAIVPIMIVFAAAETVLALAAHRRGYGALGLLFAIPGALALTASAVWLSGGQSEGLGEPMWGLTAVLGGTNLIVLLLAVRTARRAFGVRSAAPRRR